MADTTLAARVIDWQRLHGRHDLPWQQSREPYRVWLSEVMLQQTQVATVLSYYARFLQRFPDVQALASAPLDDVLAQWSGLGYYSRARNLHRCAQAVVHEHGGAFPRSSAALAALPGIGPSTAAAIAAFCFGERAAILDGNVKRVLARVLGFAGDLSLAAQQQALWARARELLPLQQVDIYTQGLMDLGATVCTQRLPACARCPLRPLCVGAREAAPQRYPVKTRRLQRGRRANALLWLCHRDAVLLQQRPDTGVWAGLWSLPAFDDPATLQALSNGWPGQGSWLPTIEHALTHFDWTLQPLRWTLPVRIGAARLQDVSGAVLAAAPAAEQRARWWPLAQALSLGLPAPVRRLLQAG